MKSASSRTNEPFCADLHSHTTCSDGTLTPKQLIALAVEIGLQGLSITDHDTIEAYDAASPEAERLGLELLAGVEFSAQGQYESVHILGYGFSLDDSGLRAFCDQCVHDRRERNAAILARLDGLGMPVTQEEVEAQAGIANKRVFGRPHIAHVMEKKGYVANAREAFDRWLGEGKPGYASGRQVTITDTIEVIHQAGGHAVIAHPHHLRHQATSKALLMMNFDGIEGYYAAMPHHRERPWIERAHGKGWIVTGGSDFHGANKAYIELGSSWVDETTFRSLQGSS